MAATIIKIKNSGVSGSPPSLATGELAYSYLAGTLGNGGDRLFIGTGTEIGGVATNIEAIGGKYFTDKLDHTLGTLTANSALLVDGDKKIDDFYVDNLRLDGNTVSSTNTNGDINIVPNGIGNVNISGTVNYSGNQQFNGNIDVNGFSDLGNLRIENNRISALNSNGNVEIQPIGTGIINMISSQVLKLPVGTTAERPTGVAGYIRYNTTDARFEGFSNGVWDTFGGVIDVDQDTYILPESSPGADTDALTFYTANVLRATLNSIALTLNDTALAINVGNMKLLGNTISTSTGPLTLDPGAAGADGLVVIEGDLQVNGTTTTVNSTEVVVEDPIFTLGGNTPPTSDDNRDRGIQFRWHDGTNAKLGFFGFDDTTSRFTYIPDGSNVGEIFSGALGDVEVAVGYVDGITYSTGNFLTNGVTYTDATGVTQFIASATEGHILQIDAAGVPFFGIIDAGTY